MRALLIALMIALLPLRGWVGDAMAQQLATASVQAPVSGAEQARHTHTDCALHGDQGSTPEPASDHGGSCSDCQVCHTMAMEAPSLASLQAASAPAVLYPVSSDFASAERALGFKPPIG